MPKSTALPANLPVDSTARLPATYEAARNAIAECARIDECKTWSDKAAALAAYALQAKDDSLRVMAVRVQDRAVRRMGELLKQVPRGDISTRFGQEGDRPPVITRTRAAEDAGISEHRRKQALRVAAVPSEDFDYAVESQDPPTVTELAALGTQTRAQPEPMEITPAPRAEVLDSIRAVYTFFQYCERTDPIRLALGTPSDIAKLTRNEVKIIDSWLDRFVASLPR